MDVTNMLPTCARLTNSDFTPKLAHLSTQVPCYANTLSFWFPPNGLVPPGTVTMTEMDG